MTRSIMDNMPCQHPQAEITAETKGDFERCKELKQWYKNHSGEPLRRKSDKNTEASLATWLDKARWRRTPGHNNTPSGRKLTAKKKGAVEQHIGIGEQKYDHRIGFESTGTADPR